MPPGTPAHRAARARDARGAGEADPRLARPHAPKGASPPYSRRFADGSPPELTRLENWTLDSWTRQENAVATVDSPGLADAYTRNFEQLWAAGAWPARATSTRRRGGHPPLVLPVPGPRAVAPHRQAHRSRARRVRIASPLLTAGPILGTLAEVIEEERVDVAGVSGAVVSVGSRQRLHREGGSVCWWRRHTTLPLCWPPLTEPRRAQDRAQYRASSRHGPPEPASHGITPTISCAPRGGILPRLAMPSSP